jgi:hypothetical protein
MDVETKKKSMAAQNFSKGAKPEANQMRCLSEASFSRKLLV